MSTESESIMTLVQQKVTNIFELINIYKDILKDDPFNMWLAIMLISMSIFACMFIICGGDEIEDESESENSGESSKKASKSNKKNKGKRKTA